MIKPVLILLFLVTAGVVFFTQTRPYFEEIKILKNDRESFGEALQRSRELQSLRDNLLKNYNEITQEDIGKLNKLLPAELDSGNLIVMFEDIARNDGLALKTIDVREQKGLESQNTVIGTPPPPYRTIDLFLNISGPYSSFIAFLADLEKSVRTIDIEDIKFSGGTVASFDFRISAKTYISNPFVPFAITSSREKSKEASEILSMLTKMRGIEIDTSFFQGEVFKSLVDFAPALEIPKEYGRSNPFIPIN